MGTLRRIEIGQGGTALESSEKQWSSSCLAGWRCFGRSIEAGRFVFLVSSRDAMSTVRFLLSVDLRCHGEDWKSILPKGQTINF